MQRCLELAAKGEASVSPNPMVGCVIVHDGNIIGEGYHQKIGGAHAEVNAIKNCQRPDLLSNSSLYVSLEPCSHHGNTPPCADLIINHEIPRVVVAMVDPNPLVSGKGIARLREAGVKVSTGLLEEEARKLNKAFVWGQTTGLAYVYLKWAESADGFVDKHRIDASQKAAKISDPLTDILSHELRAKVDGIVVGRRTFELDKPKLNVRNTNGKSPLRILLDPDLKINEALIELKESKYTVINKLKVYKDRDIEYLKLDNWTDSKALLALLFKAGIQSILVEGGPQTLSWFLQDKTWNELRRIRSTRVELEDGPTASIIPEGAQLKSSFISGSDLVEDYFFPPNHSGSPN